MLATGAVISNFPARGQGKAFLINDVEFATAQLWVRGDQGVSKWADLKGKKISTTTGTTAHVFLDNALRANGLGSREDVEIVNQRMAEAVTLVHRRSRARGGALGPVQHHGARQGAEREDARRRFRLLPPGRDRRRVGHAPGLTTTRTPT
jgi:hypothetical protein